MRALRPFLALRRLGSASLVRPTAVTPVRFQSDSTRPPRPERVFSGVKLRKDDGEISIRVNHPKFRPVGKMGIYHTVSSEGTVQLSIAPVKGSSGGGGDDSGAPPEPRYSYQDAVTINLTSTDIAQIIGPSFSSPASVTQKFVTGGGGGGGGKTIMKRLEILPPAAAAAAAAAAAPGSSGAGGDGGKPGDKARAAGGAVRLTVTVDGASVTVGITQGELLLLRNLLGVSMPWVSGWQLHLDPTAYHPAYHAAAPARGGDGGGEGEEEGGDSSSGSGSGSGNAGGESGGQEEQGAPPSRGGYERRGSYSGGGASGGYGGGGSRYGGGGGGSSSGGGGGGAGGGYKRPWQPRK